MEIEDSCYKVVRSGPLVCLGHSLIKYVMFSYFPGAPGLSVAVDSAVFEDLRSRGPNGSGGTRNNRIRYFLVGHDFNAL